MASRLATVATTIAATMTASETPVPMSGTPSRGSPPFRNGSEF
jgi:hypothetical protein